jgi:hypothetical protein
MITMTLVAPETAETTNAFRTLNVLSDEYLRNDLVFLKNNLDGVDGLSPASLSLSEVINRNPRNEQGPATPDSITSHVSELDGLLLYWETSIQLSRRLVRCRVLVENMVMWEELEYAIMLSKEDTGHWLHPFRRYVEDLNQVAVNVDIDAHQALPNVSVKNRFYSQVSVQWYQQNRDSYPARRASL